MGNKAYMLTHTSLLQIDSQNFSNKKSIYIHTHGSANQSRSAPYSKEPHLKIVGKSILFAHQIAILELLNLHHINRNKYVGSSKSKIQYNISSPMM